MVGKMGGVWFGLGWFLRGDYLAGKYGIFVRRSIVYIYLLIKQGYNQTFIAKSNTKLPNFVFEALIFISLCSAFHNN